MLNQEKQPTTQDLIGEPCPEVEYQIATEDDDVAALANGPVHKLSDLIKNGKPTVICFYSSWCNNCVTAPGKMRDFEAESDAGANMILLCIDGVSKAKGYTKGMASGSQIINGGITSSIDEFVNHSIPHYVVVDREGTVLVNYDNFHYVKVPVGDDDDD